jgi:hypothetical protein
MKSLQEILKKLNENQVEINRIEKSIEKQLAIIHVYDPKLAHELSTQLEIPIHTESLQ